MLCTRLIGPYCTLWILFFNVLSLPRPCKSNLTRHISILATGFNVDLGRGTCVAFGSVSHAARAPERDNNLVTQLTIYYV
jgi:hypothetical protein